MSESSSLIDKLHSETARINWQELQPHFARGVILYVDTALDLISIASDIAEDSVHQLESAISAKKIVFPSNDQAKTWYRNNTEFWSVVVAPYVLIQAVDKDSCC